MAQERKSQPRAKRMAPEERRTQILEAAARLIRSTGSSAVTLEQVAKAARISTPLIYKYFPKREDLVVELLDRELALLQGRGLSSIPRDMRVDRAAGATIERTLRYYDERGPVLNLLSSDPAVAEKARKSNRNSRANTTTYFIKRCVEAYGVPEDVATIAVTMVVNAPIHTMKFLGKQNIPIDRTTEVWRQFVAGGWRALEEKYGDPGKK